MDEPEPEPEPPAEHLRLLGRTYGLFSIDAVAVDWVGDSRRELLVANGIDWAPQGIMTLGVQDNIVQRRPRAASFGMGFHTSISGGDMDGDHDDDVVVASMAAPAWDVEPGTGSLRWYENRGPTKQPTANTLVHGKTILSVSTGDVDGNGTVDIAYTTCEYEPDVERCGKASVHLWRKDREELSWSDQFTGWTEVQLNDVTADNWLDLVVRDANGLTTMTWDSNSRTFIKDLFYGQEATERLPWAITRGMGVPGTLAWADVDGDHQWSICIARLADIDRTCLEVEHRVTATTWAPTTGSGAQPDLLVAYSDMKSDATFERIRFGAHIERFKLLVDEPRDVHIKKPMVVQRILPTPNFKASHCERIMHVTPTGPSVPLPHGELVRVRSVTNLNKPTQAVDSRQIPGSNVVSLSNWRDEGAEYRVVYTVSKRPSFLFLSSDPISLGASLRTKNTDCSCVHIDGHGACLSIKEKRERRKSLQPSSRRSP